jgi:hypothetical protein
MQIVNCTHNFDDVDDMYEEFSKTFLQISSACIPSKTILIREKEGRSKTISKWPISVKVNETWASNEGLFVKAKLQDKCLVCLVDTGANVTILSKKFIDVMKPSQPTLLLNIGSLGLPDIKISELGGTSVVSCMATL